MIERPDEQAIFECAGCRVHILTFWDADGRGLLRGEYILFGDTVWHPKCLDEYLKDYKPNNGEQNGPG